MKVRRAIVALWSLVALLAIPAVGSAQEKLQLGTLAPQASPWGKVFEVWKKAVNKKSEGKIALEIFYNGQMGDEAAMIGKMRAGQLDGAAVTAVGLSKVHQPILALQMPGLARDWDKLDKLRDALKGEFESGLKKEGFTLIGWGDIGKAHLMSKGFAVRKPADLKGKQPYMWRDDMISPVLFQIVGVNPVPLNVPEVLPNLRTGKINAINTPSLAAEALQWSGSLDHIVTEPTGVGIGALLFHSRRLDALPGDLRAVVTDTGAIAAKALTKRIRDEDAAAFGRLKGRMTAVDLTAAEKAEWNTLFKQVRQRLSQGTFPPALVSRMESIAGI